jgi:hypothetical protein
MGPIKQSFFRRIFMRLMTYGVCVAVFLTACATIGMQGRIENGKYLAPNGKIVYSIQGSGGPEYAVRDIYATGLDRGFFEETDIFGLRGIYYTGLPGARVSAPSNGDERRSVLNQGLTNFAMPNIFLTVSKNAEIVHQEFVRDQNNNEMLLALVRLPEMSGAFDVSTKKKFDAYPAILVLTEGGYVIVLRTQSNIMDAQTSDPKDRASHYLGGLRKMKSGLEIRQ